MKTVDEPAKPDLSDMERQSLQRLQKQLLQDLNALFFNSPREGRTADGVREVAAAYLRDHVRAPEFDYEVWVTEEDGDFHAWVDIRPIQHITVRMRITPEGVFRTPPERGGE